MALLPHSTSNNRKFWTDFFALYQSMPALWNRNNAGYRNRSARYDGYERLAEKLREIEPTTSHDDVLRKINNFRSNYRREYSRVNNLNAKGIPCKTSLWYFQLLSFLYKDELKSNKRRFTNRMVMKKVVLKEKKNEQPLITTTNEIVSYESDTSTQQTYCDEKFCDPINVDDDMVVVKNEVDTDELLLDDDLFNTTSLSDDNVPLKISPGSNDEPATKINDSEMPQNSTKTTIMKSYSVKSITQQFSDVEYEEGDPSINETSNNKIEKSSDLLSTQTIRDPQIVALISAVRCYPPLYNNRMPKYHDSEWKAKLWKSVAEECQMASGYEAKTYWRKLHRQFFLYYRNVLISLVRANYHESALKSFSRELQTDEDTLFDPRTWGYYSDMRFVAPFPYKDTYPELERLIKLAKPIVDMQREKKLTITDKNDSSEIIATPFPTVPKLMKLTTSSTAHSKPTPPNKSHNLEHVPVLDKTNGLSEQALCLQSFFNVMFQATLTLPTSLQRRVKLELLQTLHRAEEDAERFFW